MNKKISSNLRKIRKENGYTKEDIANRIGVSTRLVYNWENGISNPSIINVMDLARIYDVSIDTLLGFDLDDDGSSIHDEPETIKYMKDGYLIEEDEESITITENDKPYKYNKKSYMTFRKGVKYGRNCLWIAASVAATFIYCMLGTTIGDSYGFINFWFLFLLIPCPAGVFEAIMHRSFKKAIPAVLFGCLAAYCALGMMGNLWASVWMILTVGPAYALTAALLDKKTRAVDHEKLDEILNEKRLLETEVVFKESK